MSSIKKTEPIRVGVLIDEPLRLEGMASIFDNLPGEKYAPLLPVFGMIEELLSDLKLSYLIVDLTSFSGGVGTVEAIRRKRPDFRLIVIGPAGNDKLIVDLILAGARGFLDVQAGPRAVRQAVDEVINGSIWAPRRLLSKLVDRLLEVSDTSLTNAPLHLTDREQQVLDLILTARSNREIARQLGIEERTVQAHVGRLMRKTGADNRTDLSMRTSNHALPPGLGVDDRRQADRRRGDRRQGQN
ncbi:MAG: response regulator transcription factor [Terracidiphilus sp.]